MKGNKQGLLATMLALLVLAGAMTLIGIIVWMRMAHSTVPSQPGHSELRVPIRARAGQTTLRANSLQQTKAPADYI